ncbi:hypothetical protein, partial [Escherichia coli]|uniref:hypothetical protein n=1 Tax=Escherichia coli TaxID=562 RepID=UPI001866958C
PMIWWQSSQVYADQACMQTHASRAPVSHDHLFHTLLGMFDVKNSDRRDRVAWVVWSVSFDAMQDRANAAK